MIDSVSSASKYSSFPFHSLVNLSNAPILSITARIPDLKPQYWYFFEVLYYIVHMRWATKTTQCIFCHLIIIEKMCFFFSFYHLRVHKYDCFRLILSWFFDIWPCVIWQKNRFKCSHISVTSKEVKVRQNRSNFFKPTFRRNSILLLWDLFSFNFWRKLKTLKRHFEINWPSVSLKESHQCN